MLDVPTEKNSVAHIIYSGLGGHSAVLFALLEGGFMRGAQHTIVFAGVEEPPKEYIRRCEALKVKWHYVPKQAGKKYLKFMFSIRNKLIELNSEILFLHGLAAIPAIALIKFFSFGRKPFILVRETQANDLKSVRDWVSLGLAHRFADSVVHLTEEASKGALLRLGKIADVSKVSVVGNGLDTDFYCPVTHTEHMNGVIHIGMQSRLQPNKDHSTLIKAFSLVRDRHPDKKLHLHIAGDGSTYQTIEQMVKTNNLSQITTLHGLLDQYHLRDLLQRLDIYVHCTHGETMSTAIMQALSCGLPVIASNVAGVSNMVLRDVGMLYQPGNVDDLAEKINVLIANSESAHQLGLHARNYALKTFSISRTVESYENLILKCQTRT